jgi:TrmH family RNA methyltransferase
VIRTIEGHHNHTLKLARKLQKKKQRREKGLFVAEGLDLLQAALEAGRLPQEVLARPDLLERLPPGLADRARGNELDLILTPAELLDSASGLGGAADVLALHAARPASLGDVRLMEGLTLYLFGVGDPGNLGTLVRSAVAFGALGVIVSPGSADAFGPRALRAGMGAQFLLPVVEEVPPADLLSKMHADSGRHGGRPQVIVADPRADEDIRDLRPAAPTLLVLGSERGSLPDLGPGARRAAVRQERFDSLNVAMAGTIMLYELSRGSAAP